MRAAGIAALVVAGLTAYWIITGRTTPPASVQPAPPVTPAPPVATPQGNLILRPGHPV